MFIYQNLPILFYLFLVVIPSADCCPIFFQDSLAKPLLPLDLEGWLFFGKGQDGSIRYFNHDIIYVNRDELFFKEPPVLQEGVKRHIILGDESGAVIVGQRVSPGELPCAGKNIELRLDGDAGQAPQFLYAQHCAGSIRSSHLPKFWQQNVIYNIDSHNISSPNYLYTIDSSNYMLFKQIDHSLEGKMLPLAFESRLYLFADVKNFFSLLFDHDDIGSHMYANDNLHTGLHAAIDFYLNVLFFKVNLNLLVDAFFFPNSVYIPMKVSLPISAKKYLRETSGIFYTWFLSPDVETGSNKMIAYESGPLTEQIKAAKVFCKDYRGEFCPFTLIFRGKQSLLKMNFKLAKALIDKGFFPQLVLDVDYFQKNQHWPNDVKGEKSPLGEGRKQAGLYFNTSQLEVGEYRWDFWIEVMTNENKDKISDKALSLASCPRRARLVGIK